MDAPDASTSTDGYGFTWLTVRGGADDLSTLCTNLHVVNSTLEEQGFGHGLLCTLVPFEAPDGRRVGLVYLYKQGTFYPFAPVKGTRRRDNMLELQVRDQLARQLEIEEDLQLARAVGCSGTVSEHTSQDPAETDVAQILESHGIVPGRPRAR
nr:hypothetical protein [Nocardioides daphniae]